MKTNNKRFLTAFTLAFLASTAAPFLHAADDSAGDAKFERLTVVSTFFQEQGEFVSFVMKLKNSGTVNFEEANASANLGGEPAETLFFDLPQGSERELVFSFSKPSVPGVYKGTIIVMAGGNELRQPIELTVEPPSVTSTPAGLEQYLIPALAVLALLAIGLVVLSRRRKKNQFEETQKQARAEKRLPQRSAKRPLPRRSSKL